MNMWDNALVNTNRFHNPRQAFPALAIRGQTKVQEDFVGFDIHDSARGPGPSGTISAELDL